MLGYNFVQVSIHSTCLFPDFHCDLDFVIISRSSELRIRHLSAITDFLELRELEFQPGGTT